MNTSTPTNFQTMPGHWVLAKLGKKVLRPGGIALTRWMLTELQIHPEDEVVEFAPGLGVTTRLTLQQNPKQYIAIEQNEKAAHEVRKQLSGNRRRCLIGTAENTGLPDHSASVVYGEAMLTMQSPAQKNAIIQEAKRILKPGGRYGIHELSLTPDQLPVEKKSEICRQLAKSLRVNAKPLTISEWRQLFMDHGFVVTTVHTAPMHLLHLRNILRDEGWLGTLRIAGRAVTQPQARQRVWMMRKTFLNHASHLQACCLIAQLPPES
jgi:phospholipid N-methyltransferase